MNYSTITQSTGPASIARYDSASRRSSARRPSCPSCLAESWSPPAEQGHGVLQSPRLERRRTCNKKTCDPDSTSTSARRSMPVLFDQGAATTSHGEVHPKATSPTCEELYATA